MPGKDEKVIGRDIAIASGVWLKPAEGGDEQYFDPKFAADAVRSGKWVSARDNQTLSVNERFSGDPVNLPVTSEGIARAEARGERLESRTDIESRHLQQDLKREYGDGIVNSGRAFFEGAGRGLTLGISDLLAVKLGADREGMALRRQFNTVSALGGELAGALLPAAFTGGASAATTGLGKVLAKTPAGLAISAGRATAKGITGRTLLGRVGGLAAQGVVEGTVFGAGQGLSNVVLADKNLSADAIGSEILQSAFYGGALGGVVGGGLGLGAEGLVLVRNAAQKVKGSAAAKMFRKGANGIDDVTRTEVNEAVRGQFNMVDDWAGKARRLADNAADSTIEPSVRRRILENAQSYDDVGRAIDDLLDPAKRPILSKADELTNLMDDLAIERKLGDKVDDIAARKPPRRSALNPEDIDDITSNLAPDEMKELVELYGQKTDLARKLVDDTMPGSLDAFDSALGGAAAGSNVKRLAAVDALAIANEMGLDVKSVPLVGTPADLLLKAWLAGRAVKMVGGGGAAAATGKTLGGKIAGAASRGIIGGAGRALRNAGAATVGHMATVAGKAVSKIDDIANIAAKVSRKGAPTAVRTSSQVLGEAQFHAGLPKRRREKGPELNSLERNFAARAEELIDAVGNLQATKRTIHDKLGELRMIDPMVVQRMESTAVRKLIFLHDKLPSGRDRGSAVLGENRYRPSAMAMRKFARYVRAADAPLDTLRDQLAAGRLAPETVETLRVLYKPLYDKTRQTIMEKISTLQPRMSSSEKLQVSALLRVPIDSRVTADNIRANVQMWRTLKGEDDQQSTPQQAIGTLANRASEAQTAGQRIQTK